MAGTKPAALLPPLLYISFPQAFILPFYSEYSIQYYLVLSWGWGFALFALGSVSKSAHLLNLVYISDISSAVNPRIREFFIRERRGCRKLPYRVYANPRTVNPRTAGGVCIPIITWSINVTCSPFHSSTCSCDDCPFFQQL